MGANGSYFLPYDLSLGALGSGKNELAVARGDQAVRYGLTSGFYPHPLQRVGNATGDLVFAHFGITAQPLGYDDLAGDVRGKVVLVLDHEPGENDSTSAFDGVVTSEYANPLKKALAAQARGAAAVLFVTDVQNHQGAQNFEAASRGVLAGAAAASPAIHARGVGRQAHDSRRPDLRRARRQSRARSGEVARGPGARIGERPRHRRPCRCPAFGSRSPRRSLGGRSPIATSLAAIEGSDPRLKNEWVVISAHPDHNGAAGDTIFHGADDNGSGAVALLAIAEAYAKAAAEGQRPKRSRAVRVLQLRGRGPLMGSWGYTEAPAVPLDRTVAMINMDMIGRNEEVPENGGARFRGLPVQTSRVEQEHGDAARLEPELAHRGRRARERARTGSRSRRTTTTTRRSCSGAATAGRFSSTACRRSGFTPGCIPITT